MQTTQDLSRGTQRTQSLQQDGHIEGHINVNTPERWASIIGGGVLTLYGLKRSEWDGIMLALLGGDRPTARAA